MSEYLSDGYQQEKKNMLKLIQPTDPILHTPTQQFNFDNPPIDPSALFDELKEAMIHYNGLGLSANQVGIPYSVFVFGDPSFPDEIAGVFNPKIVSLEDPITSYDEGCLSYPGLI